MTIIFTSPMQQVIGRVVEFDCDKAWRPMVVTSTRSVTNFFVMYKDKVLPFQHNGEYGHGRERYDAIEGILSAHKNEALSNKQVAWEALRASSSRTKRGRCYKQHSVVNRLR